MTDHDITLITAAFFFIGFIVGCCLFALPSTIAFKRGVSSRWPLLWLNIFLGWTAIMWIVCLIWAVAGATDAQDNYYRAAARQPKRSDDFYS